MDSTTSLFIVYRYSSTTGTFTVPPGGDGFYYFSVFLVTDTGEWCRFDIELNGDILCTVDRDQDKTPGDEGQGSCNAGIYAAEGW